MKSFLNRYQKSIQTTKKALLGIEEFPEQLVKLPIVQYARMIWNIREMYLTIEQCARSLGRTRHIVDGKVNCPDRDLSLGMCYNIMRIGLQNVAKENDFRFRERNK